MNTLNYQFTAVPTNLYFALDTNLRNALVVMLQLQQMYGDSDGYFYRTNEDLQKDFRVGKNLTIAIIESLFRYELLQVKSVGFKNSKKQVNLYHINTEKFTEFEQFNTYTITNTKELQLETVDYRAKGFKVTYTGQNPKSAPQSLENPSRVELVGSESENVSEGLKMPSNAISEVLEGSSRSEKADEVSDLPLSTNSGVEDEAYEMKMVFEETEEYENKHLEDDVQEVVDDEPIQVIETASVEVNPNIVIEKRSMDSAVEVGLERCEGLVKRYKEMQVPTSDKNLELVNLANDYIYNQWKNGFISTESKHRLIKEIVVERFKKFKI